MTLVLIGVATSESVLVFIKFTKGLQEGVHKILIGHFPLSRDSFVLDLMTSISIKVIEFYLHHKGYPSIKFDPLY